LRRIFRIGGSLCSLCNDVVAKLAECVSDLIRDLERRGPILVSVDRNQPEAALGGPEQQPQTTHSVDAGARREDDHETRAGSFGGVAKDGAHDNARPLDNWNFPVAKKNFPPTKL
jgi:hypothetical protein